MKTGKVWLVGAGAGDKKQITIRGKECLMKADVIVYDLLVCPSLLNLAHEGCKLIFAGKKSGMHFKKQSETSMLLVELAKQGKQVVRLKGGDPFVFGRGGEEAQILHEYGIPFEIISGVSSCYSAASYAGIPVTHRDYSSSFHVIAGHSKADSETEPNFNILAMENDTQIYMMSLRNLSHIAERLIECGKNPETPAAVIQQGATPNQRVVTASLRDIAKEAERHEINTPALTVIGDVVSLRRELKWFERGILSGKKIIVTGTRKHAEKMSECLRKYGADAVEISLIRVCRINQEKFSGIDWKSFTWIVFTSENGIDIFFEQLSEQKTDLRLIMKMKFAVIGKGSAKALARHNIYADIIPEKYESRFLAEKLISELNSNDNVLIMRAENGTDTLPKMLNDAGKSYEIFPLYRTEPCKEKGELLQLNLKNTDYVVFSSSSAVYSFKQLTDDYTGDMNVKFVSIGAVTSKAIDSCGFNVECTAENASCEGIADIIIKNVSENKE